MHAKLAFGERDAAGLRAVPAHLAHVPARMFRARQLLRREHPQRLDEGSCRIRPQRIDARFGILDERQARHAHLSWVGETGGQGLPVRFRDETGIRLVGGRLCFTMFHGGFFVSLRF